MKEWLKENWIWLLGAIGTLGLSVLIQKIIKALQDKKLEELSEEEEDVIEDSFKQEVASIAKAGKTHAAAVATAYKKSDKEKKKAEAKANGRTKDLVENPEGIDVALGDMGITERK